MTSKDHILNIPLTLVILYAWHIFKKCYLYLWALSRKV